MRARLHTVEIQDFKTYRNVLFGPFDRFTTLVGPNGSGKSNFMDAVAFAIGEQPDKLRVASFIEVINADALESQTRSRASVTAVFMLPDKTEKSFNRVVKDTGSVHHRIDGKRVSGENYQEVLVEIGINIKAGSFLVYQGNLENIVLQDPKDRTKWMEELSGSANLREAYEDALFKKNTVDITVKTHFQHKKFWERTVKQAEKDVKDAEEVSKLQDLLVKGRIDCTLFRLYHLEKKMKKITKKRDNLKADLLQNKATKEEFTERLEEEMQNRHSCIESLENATEAYEQLDFEVKCDVDSIENREAMFFFNRKRLKMEESLNDARAKLADNEKYIEKLNVDLAEVEAKLSEIEATTFDTGDDSPDIVLDAEENQYRSLTAEAEKRSAAVMEQMASLQRDQDVYLDQLNWERLRLSEIQQKIKQKGREKDQIAALCFKMRTRIIESTESLEMLEAELEGCQNTEAILISKRQKLDQVRKDLNNAELSENERAAQRNKFDNIVRLRGLFGESIRGRLRDFYRPIHSRYSRGIDKVLGEFKDAIIVDEQSTATRCMNILREEGLIPEIFLPEKEINNIVKEGNIRKKSWLKTSEEEEIPFVSNVINSFELIGTIIEHLTNEAVICKTRTGAEEISSKFGLDVVSWDGVLFRASGVMHYENESSSGSSDSLDVDNLLELKAKEEKLMDALSSLEKTVQQKPELQSKKNGEELRLKLLKADEIKLVERRDSIKEELLRLQDELKTIKRNSNEIEVHVENRRAKIQELQDEIRRIQDEVFEDFCSQVDVENIQEYQERLSLQRKRSNDVFALTNRKNELISELDLACLRGSEFQGNVLRCEEFLNKCKDRILQARDDLQKRESELVEYQKHLNAMHSEKWMVMKRSDKIQKTIDKLEKAINIAEENLRSCKLNILEKESALSRLEECRRFILKDCAVKNINLPLLAGRLGHAFRRRSISDGIEIDYSRLRQEWKDMNADDEIDYETSCFEDGLTKIENRIAEIKGLNSLAPKDLDTALQNLRQRKKKGEQMRVKQKKAARKFDRLKEQRCAIFNRCFNRIAERLEPIYKMLTGSPSASAFLTSENPNEPYLGPTYIDFVVPGKTCSLHNGISTGESAMLSLAVIFAADEHQPSPFYILDEISASLDSENLVNLAAFLRVKSQNASIIVITHDSNLSRYSDLLVGVSREVTYTLGSGEQERDSEERRLHANGGDPGTEESRSISRDADSDREDRDIAMDEHVHQDGSDIARDSDDQCSTASTTIIPRTERGRSHDSDAGSLSSHEDNDLESHSDKEGSQAMDPRDSSSVPDRGGSGSDMDESDHLSRNIIDDISPVVDRDDIMRDIDDDRDEERDIDSDVESSDTSREARDEFIFRNIDDDDFDMMDTD